MLIRVFLIPILIGIVVLRCFAEKSIPVKSLPDSVKADFVQRFPNAQIKACSQEKRKGTVVYEVESIDNKLNRDIIYSPDGKALEIEERILESSLPTSVTHSIQSEYANSTYKRIEKLTRGDSVEHEVILSVDGKRFEIVADSTGKILNKK